MNRQPFHGGWYCDALPSGERAALFPLARIVRTHQRDLPQIIGDYPLFLTITNVGQFKVAGKGHDSSNSYEWLERDPVWHVLPEAIGNFSLLYDRTGQLHISKAGPVGVQGWRYEAPNGRLMTGDETYGPREGLNEYTDLSALQDFSLVVGQGHDFGGVVVKIDGVLRLLQAGACYDIKAYRAGESVTLAFYEVVSDGLTAWIVKTSLSELRALPIVRPPAPIPVPVPANPEPNPEPQPMSSVLETLIAVRAKYPNPIPEADRRVTLGKILNETAWIHRNDPEHWGLEAKDDDNSAIQPRTGRRIGKDILRSIEGWKHVGRDVLDSSGSGAATPTWPESPGPADPRRFVDPVEPEGIVVIPPPDNPPPTGDLEARVTALEQTVSRLLTMLHSI